MQLVAFDILRSEGKKVHRQEKTATLISTNKQENQLAFCEFVRANFEP